MFKFATNKFINSTSSSSGGASGALKSVQNAVTGGGGGDDSSGVSRRRILQKDLFSFNKIADKGFPSKPSAMDYDRKLRLLALGTKNGDIRIYGAPGTSQQQISSYQDVHPFPILRLLFVQGQHQIITLSERVQRNDLTNRGESQLYLILWQIPDLQDGGKNAASTGGGVNLVEKIKEYQLDPKIVTGTRLSAITLLNDNSHIFLGFETGDVYVFNVATFKIVPGVINKDYILKNLPEPKGTAKKLTQLGAVESICHHPRQLTKLLLAYQRGLWVIFDFIKNQIDQINQTSQQLESAVFYQAGECIATAHSDGSFILWDLESTQADGGSNSAPNIVYGPYPCKAVTKCLVKTCRNDQPFVIFSGGCPRVNYSDKITISVIQGENSHVCFDFTSKIIEFFTIDKPSVDKQPAAAGTTNGGASSSSIIYDNPQALLVLLEEEFVAIDLMSENWPQFKLPYLYSVHSSAIICTHYVNSISGQLYERLKQFGSQSKDLSDAFSERDWPITSPGQAPGAVVASQPGGDRKDLLLTGHEDGSISFWDVTHMSMTLIYRLRTSEYFQTDSTPADESGDALASDDTDNWPPFRKVGTFDPYSDDPKLGIQKIFLCPQREVLVAAGTAGQVLIMHLSERPREISYSSLVAHKINIIGVSPEVESHFVWKGHEPLALRGHNAFNTSRSGSDEQTTTCAAGSLKLQPGYQLHSLIQLYPPATVSALTLNSDWQLVGIGTSHGFVLFDYCLLKELLVRCTLDPTMLVQAAANSNDSGNSGTISRRKSLKKSLRESFRKLRRGRSQKPNPKKQTAEQLNSLNRMTTIRTDQLDDELNDGHRPIERQVESREFKPMDDIPPSVIRYMYFVRTFITSSHQQTNSLWVGTNTGVIYIYALQFLLNSAYVEPAATPALTSTLRANQSVNCLLAKEMRLKHKAPVVHIQVIDQNMQPLPSESAAPGSELTSAAAVDSNGVPVPANHKVIICSEEQFKVFQLPTLKPVCKFKLTAIEGARVRRIGYNCYTSRTDPKYSEYCLSCLSNLGDLSVYSLPQLKRQVQIQCMKQQDINAITSFVFSKQGQAFYLQSPSEFIHISMSAKDASQPAAPAVQGANQKALTAPPGSAQKKPPSSSTSGQPSSSNGSGGSEGPSRPAAGSSGAPTQKQAQKPAQKPANQSFQSPSSSSSSAQQAATTGTTEAAQEVPTSSTLSPASSEPVPPVPAPRTMIAPTKAASPPKTNEPTTNEEPDAKAAAASTSAKEAASDAGEVKVKKEAVAESMERLSVADKAEKKETSPFIVESPAVTSESGKICAESVLGEQQALMTKTTTTTTSSTAAAAQMSPIVKAKTSAATAENDVSVISDAAGAASSFSLNQSVISSSTTNRTNTTTANSMLRNVNSSLLIGDSLNASAINGSCVGVINSGVDLSLDSVVERYGVDNEHQTSVVKKIPPSIDEDGGHGASSSSSSARKTSEATSSVLADDYNPEEDDDMIVSSNLLIKPPQTASSPLSKGATNGHIASQPGLNGAHSIEQVTERLANGSKLEYRETAID